jgi:dTDP-4-dehydrorhamnose reductase
MKRKIIIFGSNGQLGSSLKKKIYKENNNIFFDSKNGDISDFKKIKNIFRNHKPNIVINCAAITNVDYCQKKKKNCNFINVVAVKNLSELCYNYNALLIHFSSDYIFNSNKKCLFREDSEKKPINFYGKSKLESEKKIIKSGCNYLIFRISWLFSKKKENFLYFFKNAIKKNNHNKIYVSRNYGSPTSTRLVVKILNIFLKKKELLAYKKIFHLSCNGLASWRAIFLHIRKRINKNSIGFKSVNKILSWNAKRPFCSKLSCNKIEKFLNMKLPHWKKELNHYLKSI